MSSNTRVFVQQFVEASDKENIEALHYWVFVNVIHRWTVDHRQKGQ